VTLEELLKEACTKGMVHLTLYPVHSQDQKTIYWCARATPSTGHSYVQTQTLDPIEAVIQTLKALPKAPKRSAKEVSARPRKEQDNILDHLEGGPVGPIDDEDYRKPVTETVSEAENIGSTDWKKPTTTVEDIDKPGDMNAWLPKT